MEYIFLRFQQNFTPNKKGNTKKVRGLIAQLDKICEGLKGHELSYCPVSLENELIQMSREYLVGTVWVKNDVNLATGKRITEVVFLEEHGNETLINRLTLFYGEKNIFSSRVTY